MEWNPQTSPIPLGMLPPHPLSGAGASPPRRVLSCGGCRPAPTSPSLSFASSPSPPIDEQIRQAAAVNFKNHLRLRWASEETPILQPEKEQIKTLIVPLMLSATPKIQAQLSEALAVISNHDFPNLGRHFSPNSSPISRSITSSDYASITLPALEGSGPGGVALVDELRAASTSRDRLAITAIKFLTTVSTSVHHTLFAGDGVIPQICQGIVIRMRDMEGSDLDTRRRIACELLKGIATLMEILSEAFFRHQIQSLLSSFAAKPWYKLEGQGLCYILGSLSCTKKAGSSHVSTELVDVQSFFESVIVPELQVQM
ncbi:Importin-beta, N-terminal domain [Sesbania bispinosa]|nr:Importin-beta, N-terminal domain [Sesbania bispinosa]